MATTTFLLLLSPSTSHMGKRKLGLRACQWMITVRAMLMKDVPCARKNFIFLLSLILASLIQAEIIQKACPRKTDLTRKL